MSELAARRMNAEEFLAWTRSQEGEFELIGGLAVQMMGERGAHSNAKTRLARQLLLQIPDDAPCRVHIDAMDVRAAQSEVYRPDVMIHCGALDDDATVIDDPAVIFEILSPSTAAYDVAVKAPRYLAMPSVTHVVLIDTTRRSAVVFEKENGGLPTIWSGETPLRLPLIGGLAVQIDLTAIFADARR